ncbi:MAG: thioredoxin domain-containing protein [Gemmatimonadales bacterium]|nr:thioredoxin domain-containing protein [Gemmatimonadales bacterium]
MPNRLADQPSAYLNSASEQPVDWYPWGPEAFDRARESGRPVLLDIGAVWCHWCHVMDHESYEDAAIAEILNREWICIKVDRDERPDVDARYQRAAQALTGQGGWPLTAFLTAAGEVFYAGTYFPPDNRYGRPGFRSVLTSLARLYREQPDQVHRQAAEIAEFLASRGSEAAPGDPSAEILSTATDGIVRQFDSRHGGFGSQPKFPHPGACELLLARWFDTADDDLRVIVERTLDAMAKGGIRDHLGGGFHRYSVDAQWVVPNFEKMLYDNAELLKAYVSAAGADPARTDGGRHAEAIDGVVTWVDTTMADPDGGYFASQDADVGPGDDGDYFTWTADEARAVLPDHELEVLARHYDIGEAGEMHHNPRKNVLWVRESVDDIAAAIGRSVGDVAGLLAAGRARLLHARQQRTAPFVDRTLYTAWNGMMAGAMLRTAALLDRPALRGHALRTLERFFREASPTDRGVELPHAIGSVVTGILDDQVQVADAALDAFEATADPVWLERATGLMESVWEGYRADGGGLCDTRRGRGGDGFLSQELIPIQDTPTPSPNGTAAIVLARLAEHTAEESWRTRRDELLAAIAGSAADLSIVGAALLRAVDWAVMPATHVVVVGGDDARTYALHRAALATYRPRKVVRRLAPDAAPESLPAPLAAMLDGTSPRAYVCAGTQCAPPVDEPEQLAATITSFARPGADRRSRREAS